MTDQIAVFGGGCFWCLHSALTRMKGVRRVVSGYAGGASEDPIYEQICTGTTGHAEVVQVVFDERVLPYSDLLSLFFALHDPTTLNRQGADTGTQYRSVIFYDSDQQKEQALAKIEQLKQDNTFQKAIVTELSPLDVFYPAEDYHQDYYQRNPSAGYCQAVIAPKLKQFFEQYSDITL